MPVLQKREGAIQWILPLSFRLEPVTSYCLGVDVSLFNFEFFIFSSYGECLISKKAQKQLISQLEYEMGALA